MTLAPESRAVLALIHRHREDARRCDARRSLHPARAEARLQSLYDRRRKRALAVIREAARQSLGVQKVKADQQTYEPPPLITREQRLDFARLLKALSDALAIVTPAEVRELEAISREILRWTAKTGAQQLSGLLGRPVPPAWAMTEEFVNSYLEDFLKQNTGALTDLSKDLIRDVRQTLVTATGLDKDAAADLLADRYAVSKSKAAFYAEDQAKKLQGAIDRGRFDRLGIESYLWRTVGDHKVRPEHRERDGKKFRFDQPPPDGNPSEPYGCRCYAEPALAGVDLPDLGDPNFLDPKVARLIAA